MSLIEMTGLDIEENQFLESFYKKLSEEYGEPEETFKIDTLEKADWLLTKMQKAVTRIQHFEKIRDKKRLFLNGVYNERLEKLEAEHKDSVSGDLNYLKSIYKRFGVELEAFVTESLKDRDAKSLKIAGFQVGSKTTPAYVKVEEEKDVLKWAMTNLADAVVVKEGVDVITIKKHYKETGEIPPGCKVTEAQEKPFCKFGSFDVKKLI